MGGPVLLRSLMGILDLIEKLGAADSGLIGREILSAVRPGTSSVQTRLLGMVRTYQVPRQHSVGYRYYQVVDSHRARYVRDADPTEARDYLAVLPRVHLILVYQDGPLWYAYPAHSEAYQRRYGEIGLVPVYLAEGVDRLDHIIARFDGGACWYDDLDNKRDPSVAAGLREALQTVDWSRVRHRMVDDPATYKTNIKGVTSEDAISYQLAARRLIQAVRVTLEQQIGDALLDVEAKLTSYVEREDLAVVHWVSPSGERYTSTIHRDTMQVVTAGICVSGEDRKFDLKSLVGVVAYAERDRRVHRTRFGDEDDED